MKKWNFAMIVTAIVFICTLALIVLTLISFNQTEYPMSTKVVELNRKNDIVTVEDFNGNLWTFEGCEDWEIGDICAMIMNDNGTKNNIYDDKIVKVRYCGYEK